VSRIDLRVPFTEKEAARRLGARWDSLQKIWYAPDGVDPEPLRRWVPVPQSPDVRAARYFLATSTRECWKCNATTPVHAIVLPAECDILCLADDPADDCWEVADMPAVLSYILDLAESVQARLHTLAPLYRLDYSHAVNAFLLDESLRTLHRQAR
jgi:hypothetical protein